MQREVVLVVGKTGCGKTTWARDYLKGFSRVIVADAGFDDYDIKRAESFPALAAAIRQPFFRVAFNVQHWEWPFVFEAARAAAEIGGPLLLVLEEAYRAGDIRAMPEYDDAVNQGRHWGLSLVAISTRAAKLPTDYKAQATRIIAFQQHLPNDVDYMEDIIGESAEQLPRLPRFTFLDWTLHGDVTRKTLGGKTSVKITASEHGGPDDLPALSTAADDGGDGPGENGE